MTLPEVLIAAALSVLMAAALFSHAAGERIFAARSAIDMLDAQIAQARAIAATGGNGATLVFVPAPNGFGMRLYQGRPNAAGALSPAGPRFTSAAEIREAALGAPPFTVFFDGAGHASAMAGAQDGASLVVSEPACPGAGGAVVLEVADSRLNAGRQLACKPR